MSTDKRRGHLRQLRKMPLARHLGMVAGLFSKPNLYFRMPKAASRTIAAAVGADTLVLSHRYRPATINALLQLNPRSFKFTFVRHPLSRFCSAYRWATRDRIDPQKHPFDLQLQDVILAQGDINQFCSNLAGLLANKKFRMMHFYPQSAFIFPGQKPLLDFVGKYENLEQGCEELRAVHGYELQLSFGSNAKNTAKTAIEHPLASLETLGLNPSSIDALCAVYAKDFRVFNYDQ